MILQDTYEVKKADIIPVEVSVPGSKSITNRALLIAALANGKSVLKGVLFSDDSRHFLQALQDLGFVVEKGAGFQRQKLPLMWEVQELLPVF